MSLYEKIIAKYPNLKSEDFHHATGTILLVDDSDGYGPRIEKWNHPDFERPSDSELGIKRAPAIIDLEAVVEAPVLEAPAE
jgi:hypothetical protein